jgi:hypothetical protein
MFTDSRNLGFNLSLLPYAPPPCRERGLDAACFYFWPDKGLMYVTSVLYGYLLLLGTGL